MTASPMTYPQHIRAVLTLGLPLIGGHLAQFAIGLTDTVMMGWYGVPELAALTLAGSYFFVLLLFGSGYAWAIMPMVAGFHASDEERQIRRATRMALWLAIGYFVLAWPLLWFSKPLLLSIGQTDNIAENAQTYLRWASWGLLPAIGVMTLKSYLAGLEFTRVAFWITLCAALVNVVANYALIFGNWGLPEMGLRGAALASVIVHCLSFVLLLIYALRILPQHEILARFWRPDWEMLGKVFALGLPIALTTLAEVALFTGSAAFIGWLGEVPLAAHGIALQCASATFLVHLGLANAGTVRAGAAMARRDPEHLVRGAQVVLGLSLAAVALTTPFFVLIPETLLGLFINPADPARDAIIAAGTTLMILAALFQLTDGTQVIHLGLLRGLQDTKVPMALAVVSYWGVGLPVAYVFGFPLGFGAGGVWMGLVMGLLTASVLLGWRFWRSAVPHQMQRRYA